MQQQLPGRLGGQVEEKDRGSRRSVWWPVRGVCALPRRNQAARSSRACLRRLHDGLLLAFAACPRSPFDGRALCAAVIWPGASEQLRRRLRCARGAPSPSPMVVVRRRFVAATGGFRGSLG